MVIFSILHPEQTFDPRRISPTFYFKIPNPGLQIRQIPDPEIPVVVWYDGRAIRGPFPSGSKPLFQSKAKCEANNMKMIFYSPANKIHFHKQLRFCTQPRFESKSLWNSEEVALETVWCLQFLNSNHHYVLYCIKVKASAIIEGNIFKTEKKWESVFKEVISNSIKPRAPIHLILIDSSGFNCPSESERNSFARTVACV